MRSRVNLRHLDVLVAEVPLPLCVPADLVLSEDVRDQISCKVAMVQTQRFDLQRKKTQKQTQNKCRSLTFIARWCEIVHEVAKEIIKLHRKETKRL